MTAAAARSRTFPALGTTISLMVTDVAVAEAAEQLLRSQLDELDRACSRFRPGSELSVAQRAGRPVRVSPFLAQLVEAALWAARFTDGAVDPTVGVSMEALGYDRDFSDVKDGAVAPKELRPAPGWHVLELDRTNAVLSVPPGVQLDLGSSAKAFAADRAARDIAERWGTGALVNLGGDIAVAGAAPEEGWPVGLALDAATAPGDTGTVVALSGGGLASSGTTVRRWRRGGRLVHHIVDPRTGDAVDGPWALVSVVATSCLAANAASTAAIVAGDDALHVLGRMGLPARLLGHDGRVVALAGWPAE